MSQKKVEPLFRVANSNFISKLEETREISDRDGGKSSISDEKIFSNKGDMDQGDLDLSNLKMRS